MSNDYLNEDVAKEGEGGLVAVLVIVIFISLTVYMLLR